MTSEINKFSLNWLFSVIAPGSLIVLFSLWGYWLYYPETMDLLVNHEVFCAFIFLLSAFVTGILADGLSQQIEQNIYSKEKKHPRQKVFEKNPHWLEDLDNYYFDYLGIHLYDWDKKENKPKEGTFNGKKLNSYNLSQFEHYASYILSREAIYSTLEMERSKYLLCRNLSHSLLFCTLLSLIYGIAETGINPNEPSLQSLFHHPSCCIIISILTALFSFYLSYTYKRFRLDHSIQLYRNIRYYYLTTIKPKSHEK
jgi:hypothetical protein